MFTNPSKPFNINLNAQHVNETTHFDLVRLLDALEYVDKYEEIQEWQATPL